MNDRKKIKMTINCAKCVFYFVTHDPHGHGDAKNLGSNHLCQTTRLKVQLAWNVLTIRRKSQKTDREKLKMATRSGGKELENGIQVALDAADTASGVTKSLIMFVNSLKLLIYKQSVYISLFLSFL